MVLNKDKTKLLHGIAILMMLYHHMFITGNTWFINGSKSIFDVLNVISRNGSAQIDFACFCKMCVAIFAFTSGVGIYNQLGKYNNLKDMYKYCLKRLLSFYIKYLLVFVIFVTIEYINGNQDGFDYSLLNIVLNVIGIRATFNGTWWYVLVYDYMVLISPLVYLLLNKLDLKGYLIIIGAFILSVIIAFVTGNLIPYLKGVSSFIQHYQIIYLIIFMEGMFICKYPILDWLYNKLNIITAILLFAVCYIVRNMIIRAPSDSLFDIVFIIPVIVSMLKIIGDNKYINKVLGFLGKYSTYMWLDHAYFFAYLFFRLVFKCDYSFIVYIQVIGYSLLTAILLTFIENLIYKKHN